MRPWMREGKPNEASCVQDREKTSRRLLYDPVGAGDDGLFPGASQALAGDCGHVDKSGAWDLLSLLIFGGGRGGF